MVPFGSQVHSKGILGGTEEAGRHVGYLTKYLIKTVARRWTRRGATDAQHRGTPSAYTTNCRSRPVRPGARCGCHGINPKGTTSTTAPGHCKGRAHRRSTLGLPGRRVLVSRKWSGKTLTDHRAERGEFVRQLLEAAGIQPTHGPQDGPYQWERPAPADPDVPPRPVLLLHAIAERARWKAEYTAAQLAASNPPGAHYCQPPEGRAA